MDEFFSIVTIEPKVAMDKILKMISNISEIPYDFRTKHIVETFYTEDEISAPYFGGGDYPIKEDGQVLIPWLCHNIGSRYIDISTDDELVIKTQDSKPSGFIIKLYSILISEFNDVSIFSKCYANDDSEIGVILIKDGFYAEDIEYLDSYDISDVGYRLKGFENVEDIREYLVNIYPNIRTKINNMDYDDLINFYIETKEEIKFDEYFPERWNEMLSYCDEAISSKDFDFPIRVIKKIANVKYEIIKNCYPFN